MALEIEDIVAGLDWVGRVMWEGGILVVYENARGEVQRVDCGSSEIKGGPKSDLIWRDEDFKQRSRVKERYPERWGRYVRDNRGVLRGVCGRDEGRWGGGGEGVAARFGLLEGDSLSYLGPSLVFDELS